MTAPLDEILRRIEHLERRIARIEALAGTGKANVDQAAQLRAALEQARTQTIPLPANNAEARGASAASTSAEMRAASSSAGAAVGPAAGPPTLRLAPIPPKEPFDALPDLSLLDEKVDPKKGPAQKLEVRSALEDYPRICARVQQLWGTAECEGYLNTLVIDTRGNRQGFPPPMMEELLYLGRLARALVIINIGGDLWDGYDQAGDRR